MKGRQSNRVKKRFLPSNFNLSMIRVECSVFDLSAWVCFQVFSGWGSLVPSSRKSQSFLV